MRLGIEPLIGAWPNQGMELTRRNSRLHCQAVSGLISKGTWAFYGEIRNCTKLDYDQIDTQVEDFWGSDRTLGLDHPMFIYGFGNSAFVIKDGNCVAAYLFGPLADGADRLCAFGRGQDSLPAARLGAPPLTICDLRTGPWLHGDEGCGDS